MVNDQVKRIAFKKQYRLGLPCFEQKDRLFIRRSINKKDLHITIDLVDFVVFEIVDFVVSGKIKHFLAFSKLKKERYKKT